jgi:hypothetical protein
LFALFIVVGLVLVGVGAWALTGHVDVRPTVDNFLQILTGIGAAFVITGTYASLKRKPYDPDRIVFDTREGRLILSNAPPSGPTVEVPFEEVHDFDVRVASSTSTGGARSTSTTIYEYFAVARTSFGSVEFHASSSRADAERAIEAARAAVARPRSAPPAFGGSAPALPGGLDVRTDGAGTRLRWKNDVAGELVLFVLMVAAIGFVLSRFAMVFAAEARGGAFQYGIFGFLSLVLGFIVVANLRRFVRDLRTVYELTLDGTSVRYAELPRDDPEAAPRKLVELPAAAITRVVFDHHLGEAPTPVLILRADEAEARDRRQQGIAALRSFLADLSTGGKAIALDVVALSAIERVMLAQWVQSKVRTAP